MLKDDVFDNTFDEFEPIKSNIKMDNFYKYSLKDIDKIEDKKLKLQILGEYNNFIKTLPKQMNIASGLSIMDLLEELEIFEYENTSNLFWPTHHIIIFNHYKSYKSRKHRLCHLCSEIINPGQSYLVYRPLLADLDSKSTYVLQNNIIIKKNCGHYMPSNIQELEIMQINIENSYNRSESDNLFPNNNPLNVNKIIYSEMSNNLDGGFDFIKLKKK